MTNPQAPGRLPFLAGVRILELGDGVAGSAATSLLWALGAEVSAVIDDSSPHRHGRPVRTGNGQQVSLLPLVLDRGKQLLPAPSSDLSVLEQLVTGGSEQGPFDLVVCDRVGGLRGALAQLSGLGAYQAFIGRVNRSAWVTISAFGLSGPRGAYIATELTIAAATGMLSSVSDPQTGQPMKLAGRQSLLSAAQAAALAGCHALDLACDGTPVHLDLSAAEATIATGPTIDVVAALLHAGPARGAKRYGAPASFYACQDGMMRISAMEDHQWQGVVRAMGSPTWAARFSTTDARIEGASEIDQRIGQWTRTLAKGEAETIMQANGVPATAMYAPAEILASPQLAFRGSLEEIVAGEAHCRIVGSPYRLLDGTVPGEGAVRGDGTGPASASPAVAASGGRARRRLRGLRILEVSHVLAAPLAGAVLGALGADVTKLEDLRRLDMYRRRGPYIDFKTDANWSAYFAMVNHSKHSVAFDVDASPERFGSLLADADAVLENLGSRRARHLGISAPQLARTHPDVLAVSSSGFGLDGPFASYRAYAYNLHASCGLGYLTRNEDGRPAEIDQPWADLVSGYALATVIAAWAVGPLGNAGAGVDFSMADYVMSHFNEFIAAASIDADSDECADRANELSPCAPNGVYPGLDGWIAISVEDDEQFARLRTILAGDELSDPGYLSELSDSDYLSRASRFAARHELDSALSETCRGWAPAELAARLRAAGVPAEELVRPDELPDSEQLAGREFFTTVDHPEWGRRRLIGVPWRPFGEGPIPLGAPPLLVPEPAAPATL